MIVFVSLINNCFALTHYGANGHWYITVVQIRNRTLVGWLQDRCIHFSIAVANALSVDIKTVSGLLGENGTVIECSYTKENVIKIDYVRIMALKESQTTFAVIVVYVPNGMSSLTPEGQFLKGRVTLANIDQSSTKAVMIFNKLMCIDDTSYRCNVRYTDSSLDGKETTSNNMSIQVQGSYNCNCLKYTLSCLPQHFLNSLNSEFISLLTLQNQL